MKQVLLSLVFLVSFFCGTQAQDSFVLQEDFENNAFKWPLGKRSFYDAQIQNGKYSLNLLSSGKAYNFWKDIYINPNKEFEIETQIRILESTPQAFVGITWGSRDNGNRYTFVISPQGVGALESWKQGKSRFLKEWQEIPLTDKPNSFNKVLIRQQNKVLSISVNDQRVIQVPALSFRGSMQGFVLEDKIKLEIDYLHIRQEQPINLVENATQGYQKENLGANVNSPYADIAPVISPDGKTLYFTRKWDPGNMHQDGKEINDDIWFSQKNEQGVWSKSKNLGKPLNNLGHNALISVSADNNSLLVMNTYNPDGSLRGGGVSLSKLSNTGWEIPQALDIDGFRNRSKFSNFCLAPNGQVLVMSIEQDDTQGAEDLYVSFRKKDNTWSLPKNLGPKVNSFASDFAPFIAADNRTMYYSSRGRNGYGEADVYLTRRLDDSWTHWSEPENLGPEINGDGFDAYYTVPASGDYAYMVSSHEGMGREDIFRIKLSEGARPDPVVLIYGKVYDQETKQFLSADIRYFDLVNNQELGEAISNPQDGSYQIILPYGKQYSFLGEKKNYYSISENIDVSQVGEYIEIEKDLYLNPIKVGATIRLNNVFFEYNRDDLRAESSFELDRLVEILSQNPGLIIEVAGHTDDIGYEDKNQDLSQRRAGSVVQYLMKKGISQSRLNAKGYGELKPIASNDSEEGRQKNRRVEFTILKNSF